MIGDAITVIAVTIFLTLHFPLSRGIARAMVVPSVRAKTPRRFQFLLVDWLALLVILQVIFACIVPLRDGRAIRMPNWIPLTYCLGSVTLCWWASVREINRGDIQRPLQRFLWVLCLVPLNAMQTLVVAWLGLAFVASIVILVIGGAVAILVSFPIAAVLIGVVIAGLLGHRRTVLQKRNAVRSAIISKPATLFEDRWMAKISPEQFLSQMQFETSAVEESGAGKLGGKSAPPSLLN